MKAEGRMILKSISNSKGFASLSPEAAVLFCMLIPHLDAHGKMFGGPGYIKEVVCPRVKYLTPELLQSKLREISEKTRVKWFEFDGRWYIHSLNFLEKHQNLPTNKIGRDKLPSYSGVTPELLPHEVEVEVEVEDNMSGSQANTDDAPIPFDSIPYQRICNTMNGLLKTRFRVTDNFRKLVKARCREGFVEGDFEAVCKIQLAAWGNDPKMAQYLRPETLFSAKMNSYIGRGQDLEHHDDDRADFLRRRAATLAGCADGC